MARLAVDFSRVTGPIRKVNGVGQPPLLGAADFSLFHFLKEANIPYSRLHDVGGTYGGGRFVDIPNVFPNFDADENDPASYAFHYTDWMLAALAENGVEPVYRLGVTIENAARRWASPRIHPPKDFAKWARICEHVIRHYNEGWADGLHLGIVYWEIWNEPDGHFITEENEMWRGTKEEYFSLYETTANHLKRCFPDLKIGGYASCGFYALTDEKPNPRSEYFLSFARDFLSWISSPGHRAPLDFFSWHSYAGIEQTMKHASFARALLDEYGFEKAEHHLNEWNPSPRVFGLMKHAAQVGGMLCALQSSTVDAAMFYDARIGVSEYGSLFNPVTREPYADYDAFVMFGRLLSLGSQVHSACDAEGVYAVAATDGREKALMIVNTGDCGVELALDSGCDAVTQCCVTDENGRMRPAQAVRDGVLALTPESLTYLTF